jgi:hypothetical protein
MFRQLRAVIFIVPLLILMSTKLYADTRYYALVFASFNKSNPRWDTHSFASFVKVEDNRVLEKIDISWLPYNFDIHIFDLVHTYKGNNFTLAETLRWIESNNFVVERTNLLPINRRLFDLAKNQASKLNLDLYKYKVINVLSRTVGNKNYLNCLQAIGSIDPSINWQDWTSKRGREATYLWIKTYRKALLTFDPYEESMVDDQEQVILNQIFTDSFIPDLIKKPSS